MSVSEPHGSSFQDPAADSAGFFRIILDAMARPGRIHSVHSKIDAPAPLIANTAATLLTLVDYETPLWVSNACSNDTLLDYCRFHTGCPITKEAADAVFALIMADAPFPDLSRFAQGTQEYPDRSATLIIQTAGLSDKAGVRLTGPGIEVEHRLGITVLDGEFWRQVTVNNAQFPLGLDFIFTAPDAIAACPRSSRIDLAEAA